MGMIDAHVHVHDKKYDKDRDEVIARFFDHDGEAMVSVGTSIGSSRDAVDLAERYEKIYATVGLHPHIFNGGAERHEEWEIDLGADVPTVVRRERLEDALHDLEEMIDGCQGVVAVGEVGLDYFSHDSVAISDVQRQWQAEAFHAQIVLARRKKLPVVIHCRPEDVAQSDAYFDCVSILKDYGDVPFVMHCYMGNREVTKQLLDLQNVVFSFAGNVTYSKSEDDEMSAVIRMIPLERMMLETDAPYLTPVPYRGTRNDPVYVCHVAKHIASRKQQTHAVVIARTTETARRFFYLTA